MYRWAPIGVFHSLPDGKIIMSNRFLARILGFGDNNELPGKNLRDFYFHKQKEDKGPLDILKKESIESGLSAEILWKKKDNSPVWISLTVHPVRDEEEEIKYYEGFVTDINGRKQAEESLARLNRELRAISSCNQTLLRAVDEQTLLNEICRIICDEAGYRLAWVGYAENDREKTIRPVAWAGFDSGYIENARLSWSEETDRGRGPAGIAIRTGEIIYIQDFTTDSRFLPWRENALKRGYRSGIFMPLRNGKMEIFGVLLIYSSEANVITEDEVRLLTELAGDLAFGITTLNDRTENKRIEKIMQARLRLLEYANTHSLDEFVIATIDEIEALTGSTFGFYHFLGSDQKTVTRKTWSTNTINLMSIAAGNGKDYDITQESVWVDCTNQRGPVIHNDFASLPHSDGIPEGQTQVFREIVVPIFRGDNIRGIIGAGNKTTDYNKNDTEIIAQLGDLSWDIAERKFVEMELRESQKRLKAVFDNAADGILVADAKLKKFIICNPTICKMLGYNKEEILSLDITEIHPVKDIPYVLDQFDKQAHNEFSLAKNIPVIRKDGSIFYADINAFTITLEGRECLVGFFRDITERRQVEEALLEERKLFIGGPNVAFKWKAAEGWPVEYVSPNIIDQYGYTPDEFTSGKIPFANIIHPDDLMRVSDEVSKYSESLVPCFEQEYRIARKDGEYRWIHDFTAVIRNPAGVITSYHGHINDITEHKGMEEELQTVNKLHSRILDNSTVGIAFVRNRIFEWVNPRMPELFRLKMDEMQGASTLIIYPDEQSFKQFGEETYAILAQGQKGVLEIELKRGDGSLFWCRLEGTALDPSKPQDGSIWIWEDITERKLAEESLRASEERFSKVFRLSPVLMAIFRAADGLIVDANDVFIKETGYAIEEITGHSITELQLFADPEDHNKIVQILDEKGSLENYEFRIRDKSGNTGTGLNTTIGINLGGEKHFLSLIQNITERKQQEEELLKAKEKAEESDRLKTAFLHNISHEIRTPMNAIVGFSGLLGMTDLPGDTRQSYIQTIQDGSYQLLSIINDIVDISSIEADLIKRNISSFNINLTLKSLYKQFQLKAAEKNNILNLSLALDDKDATIQTDSTRLIQIISNLINNALKFTSQGVVDFGYRIKDPVIEFYVSDTGIGISTDQHSKIFESFYQVENTISRQFGGTGLGLAICKAFTELLGGKIWLTSEPGKGSVFYFTIPWKTSNPDLKELPGNTKKRTTEITGPLSILIAEDDDLNYKLIYCILSAPDIEIVRAHNGKEAVDLCISHKIFDLVLMDLKMPEMDGYTATGKIKAFRPKLPVIAQTAFVTDREKAMDCGCDDFISKPFKKEEILSVIKKTPCKGCRRLKPELNETPDERRPAGTIHLC